MVRRFHGDDGQDDGDNYVGASSVKFAPRTSFGIRSPLPPWHLWGNTQNIDINVQAAGTSLPFLPSAGQLVKVSYKRPETWHWILSAQLISGPVSDVSGLTITVFYDLTVGIGRAALQLQNIANVSFVSQSFERHQFVIGVGDPFPVGAKIWTTQALAPNRNFRTDVPIPNQTGNAVPPEESASVIDRIVAQDIQLNCRVFAVANVADAAVGQPVRVEVSAQFAPGAHIRPDWYREGPEEIAFPGAEQEGR